MQPSAFDSTSRFRYGEGMRCVSAARRSLARVLACTALLAATRASAANTERFSLEIQSRVGVQIGLARELVYSGGTTISELLWPFQPVLYVGTALELRSRFGLFVLLDARSAFPGRSGAMENSDYLNYELGDLRRTHYSRQDCYTERAVTLDVQAGWSFHLARQLHLEPFLAFGLMQYKWTARDGYFQYPTQTGPPYDSWDPAWAKVPISGTSIIYQQTYLFPAAGLALETTLGERFEARLSFSVSPLVFCRGLDNHVQRTAVDTDYYDSLRFGLLLEPAASLGLSLNQRARLSLEASYRRISGLLGDTAVVPAGPSLPPGQVSATYKDGAGASYDALSLALAIAIRL